MNKHTRFAVIFTVAIILITCVGCSQSAYHILSGTLHWSKGNYDEAVYSFLSAETIATAKKSLTNLDYARCGLAACYYELNEQDAAAAVLDDLRASSDERIASFAWYTDGLLAYKNQKFTDAANCFKKSLQYDMAPADARINLELSISAAQNKTPPEQHNAIGTGDSHDKENQSDPLSQIIRNREEQQWKSMYYDMPPQSQDY